jgi:hypothetical protein
MLTTRTLPAALLTTLMLAACGAAAGPSAIPASTPEPTPTAVPGAGGAGGGGSSGNTGSGVGGGGIIDPGGGIDPNLGQATRVVPAAGLVNKHPVNVQLIRAAVDEQGATAELRWWSGVAPCNALDSVRMDKDDAARTIRLTVIEGSAPGDMACIDLAQLKATVVDLGQLAAGAWTISAEGDAPPVGIEIS